MLKFKINTFGRKSDIEADDCLKCDEYCDMVVKECTYADYPCDKCAIQTAFDKLAEYEDLDEKDKKLFIKNIESIIINFKNGNSLPFLLNSNKIFHSFMVLPALVKQQSWFVR